MAYIFDLTTLANWRRAVVGVVRVEREIANWAASNVDGETVFAVHDTTSGQLMVLPVESARAIISGDVRVGETPARPRRARKPLRRAVRKVRRILARAGWLPGSEHVAFHRATFEETLSSLLGLAGERDAAYSQPKVRSLGQLGATPLASCRDATLISVGFGSSDWLASVREIKNRGAASYVASCHDLIPVRHPHFVPADYLPLRQDYLADLFWTADLVISVSHTAQREAIDYCRVHQIPSPAMAVVSPGCDLPAPEQPCVGMRAGRYVLYVSSIEPRKNHRFLYELWCEMRREKSIPDDFKLVLVGECYSHVEETVDLLRRDPLVAGSVVMLNGASDGQLAWLYGNARICVHPSMAEGYGIPVAEALGVGAACLCSDDPALVENFGHCASIIPLHRRDDWKQQIIRLCHDDAALRSAREKIAQFNHPISWARAAGDFFAAVDAYRDGTR